MIEIIKYKEVNKNDLCALIDIKVKKWGNLIIKDICYFRKNNQRWISFPSKQYEKDGKKMYYKFISFEEPSMMQMFQEKILDLIDSYLNNKTKNEIDYLFPIQEELPM